MTKLNQILIGILVLQIGLAAFAFWPRNAAQAGSGPLLPDFAADEVVGVTIEDNSDNQIVLAKDGDAWILPEAGDFPADGEKLMPFLEKFEGVESNRLVTRTEASHNRLGVGADEFERRVTLEFADGSESDLFIGTSAGAGATHVRLAEQPEVFLTAALSSFDANVQASGWIDPLYFTVPTTATTALTLENANGTFEFEKDGESWTLTDLAEDETFNESSLTSLLNQASSVQMTAPLDTEAEASYGLREPQAVVTLETDDQTYTLTIGAQDETTNDFFVSSSESPYYVRVAEFTGNNFVDKTRDDFLVIEGEAPAGEEGGVTFEGLEVE